MKPQKNRIAPVIVMAGVLSLSAAPAFARRDEQNSGRTQTSQSRQQAATEGKLISAETLQNKKVVDARNREVGTISNLFIDPQSGKIQRADIEFSTSMFGANHEYSVEWDKLDVKRQGNEVVVTLDESVVQRVQRAGKNGRVADGNGIYNREAREQNATDARADRNQQNRGGGVLGFGGSDRNEKPITASQLSSEQIRKVQQKLNQEGFHAGQVDGNWSSQTQTAIRNFQETKGLKATGQLDQRTINELGLDADEFGSRSRQQSGSESGGTPRY